MFTFKHNRRHDGLVTATLTAGTLVLGLAGSNALAMGSPSSHDVDLDRALAGQSGSRIGAAWNPADYVGGRVGRLPRTAKLTAAQGSGTTSASREEYIGGPVGRLPRPTAVR